MLEPYPLNTRQRRIEDIRETEYVAELFTSLGLCIDSSTSDHFERLIEIAGTKEFIPMLSKMQQALLAYKQKKFGGYIVSQKQLQQLRSKIILESIDRSRPESRSNSQDSNQAQSHTKDHNQSEAEEVKADVLVKSDQGTSKELIHAFGYETGEAIPQFEGVTGHGFLFGGNGLDQIAQAQ